MCPSAVSGGRTDESRGVLTSSRDAGEPSSVIVTRRQVLFPPSAQAMSPSCAWVRRTGMCVHASDQDEAGWRGVNGRTWKTYGQGCAAHVGWLASSGEASLSCERARVFVGEQAVLAALLVAVAGRSGARTPLSVRRAREERKTGRRMGIWMESGSERRGAAIPAGCPGARKGRLEARALRIRSEATVEGKGARRWGWWRHLRDRERWLARGGLPQSLANWPRAYQAE
ncbi:hypothetical protein HETIRDRAFT_441642 [Heterobasidion irregulare TC 32-1]|uniref:Uncharacterized protein n=1 Tax=Heterobasidion irregulare (strain TC 32-1) TaxID=747525 RepID=W4JZF0_HETIT|nr:uncharacterized protein HETIRDRAFT_441642 [Heterobasidion irregulare TC 32-1]ETW78460.1 hypothetical protein HETIRDRAFT_441642 [Heterobasidion irregulare TC 32-1]